MKIEIKFLDKLLQVMREWEIPNNTEQNKQEREKCETKLKDILVENKNVIASRIQDNYRHIDMSISRVLDIDIGYATIGERPMFWEIDETNETHLYWVHHARTGVLLRKISGFPLQLKQKLEDLRKEKYSQTELW